MLLDGGGRQMHNRPDRGGTGRSGRRSATSAAISRDRAVRHSTRTLRVAGQVTDSTTSARAGPGLAAGSR